MIYPSIIMIIIKFYIPETKSLAYYIAFEFISTEYLDIHEFKNLLNHS